ncbi:hypothetical protein [Edaphobacter modestus]|uniref:Uncharacterized protein n=1 Tax=Edaphobacter modestus TaxID=388466 RepID=A0A4Q7YNN4_9BACT|nr:hypothetical protein [Edaphobacter modestus]RZU38958.1 hypothetical protein BDD14_0273 [Edaphobacter modestus]
MFYIDSTVDEHGAALDASILENVAARMPCFLLIPEEHTEKHCAYSAPFQSFLFHGDIGTAKDVFYVYPNAFRVNMVNDVNSEKLAAARQQLGAAVTHGDVLIVHGD